MSSARKKKRIEEVLPEGLRLFKMSYFEMANTGLNKQVPTHDKKKRKNYYQTAPKQ